MPFFRVKIQSLAHIIYIIRVSRTRDLPLIPAHAPCTDSNKEVIAMKRIRKSNRKSMQLQLEKEIEPSELRAMVWRNKRTKPLLLSDGEFTAFHWGKRASSCGLLVCILRFLHRELGGKVSQFMEEMDLIGLLTADALAHRSNYGIGIPIPAIL